MRSFRQRKTHVTESVEQYSTQEAKASSSGLPTSLLTLVCVQCISNFLVCVAMYL